MEQATQQPLPTTVINFDEFKCRCSGITKLLANSKSNPVLTDLQVIELCDLEKKEKRTPKQDEKLAELLIKRENGKKVILSDTAIEYLMEYYALVTTKKKPVSKEMMYIQYTEKGKDVEEQSITLLSVVDNQYYQKNTERVFNDFLSGEPDVFKGEMIMLAEKITDTKSVWDYPGFLKMIHTPLNPVYDNQIKGYMDITGAQQGEIAYCLVNTPPRIVENLKRSLLYQMDVVTEESPEYLAAALELERSCFFDDIPAHKRVWKVKIEPFTPESRQKLYDRVKIAREWLWKFDEMYQMLNK